MKRVRVRLRTGTVVGLEAEGSRSFRGIPFGAAPRFAAPTPVRPWTRREAFSPGPAPVQPAVTGLGMRGAGATAEDCLNLNVFTPGGVGGGRPVMAWIFGGGFVNGDAADPLFDGRRLAAEQDVVVVAFNYRLGAWGFLDHADSNVGLRDQLAALRWIAENVSAFGGDPANVTLFGESSGAMSICDLLTVPEAQGLFHRAITQSGAGANVATAEQARLTRDYFFRYATKDAASATLLDAQMRVTRELLPELRAMPFRPWVDGDLLAAPPEAAAGRGAAVPLLAGFTRDEQRLYISPRARLSDASLLETVTQRLASAAAGAEAEAARIVAFYRTRIDDANVNAAILAAVETELRFRQPMLRYVAARERAFAGNTWLFRFNWPSPALKGWLKACHAIEIPFVFGNLNDPTTRKFVGPGAEPLSARVRAAWAHFARHGRPPSPWPPAPEIVDIHPGFAVGPANEADAMWNALFGS